LAGDEIALAPRASDHRQPQRARRLHDEAIQAANELAGKIEVKFARSSQ
jgi:hypothetical protein